VRRHFVRRILVLIATAGAVVGSAARADHRPDRAVKPLGIVGPRIAGTTWVAQGGTNLTRLRFEENGTLNYSNENGSYRNGTWKQTGGVIYFETNNKYFEFKGTIQGNQIAGDAWNVAGEKQKPVFRKRAK